MSDPGAPAARVQCCYLWARKDSRAVGYRARGWGGLSAAGVPVLTWLVFTAMALWCEAALAFVAVHALLFALGTDVAGVGLILTGVVLVATPFVTAYLVRRATRRAPVAR